MENTERSKIPVWEKYLLSVKEASQYFNIGENKLYRIANDYSGSEYRFVIQNGSRTMINRKKFEEFLNNLTSI
ncbi:MAG: excisionase [Candidatus Ornithomonoglobus sp.]